MESKSPTKKQKKQSKRRGYLKTFCGDHHHKNILKGIPYSHEKIISQHSERAVEFKKKKIIKEPRQGKTGKELISDTISF